MANWSPTLVAPTANYVTLLDTLQGRDSDSARMDENPTNPPPGYIRFSRGGNQFQEWSGSAWTDKILSGAGGGTGVTTGLTSLNAANIDAGIIADARLSSNIPRLNAENIFAAMNNFQNKINVTTSVEVRGSHPYILLYDLDGNPNSRWWEIVDIPVPSGHLVFRAKADSGTFLMDSLILNPNGDVSCGRNLTASLVFSLNGMRERSRALAMGEWFIVPNNAADFGGAAALTVTTFVNRAYILVGKTMTYAFRFTVNITGAGGWFSMNLPAGFVSAKSTGMPYWIDQRAAFMYAESSGAGFVFTYDNFASNFPIGSHDIVGVFTFELQ